MSPGQEIFQGEGAYRFTYNSATNTIDGNPLIDWIACILTNLDTSYDLVLHKMENKLNRLKK